MPSERSQLHLINKKACCYLTKKEPMRKDIISRPRGGLKILCKIKVHLTNENTKPPKKLKKGQRILPQVHFAFRPHYSEQAVEQEPLVLDQREGFQLMQLRLGFQEAPKVEEIVLQPLEPSGKNPRGSRTRKRDPSFTAPWLKLSTKGVLFCSNLVFIACLHPRVHTCMH